MITRQTALFEYCDKVLNAYLRLMLRKFRKMQNNLLSFDELNVANTQTAVTDVYAEVLALALEAYRKIARHYYRLVRKDEDFPLDMWLSELLEAYDPVTYYLFFPEHDRKRRPTTTRDPWRGSRRCFPQGRKQTSKKRFLRRSVIGADNSSTTSTKRR